MKCERHGLHADLIFHIRDQKHQQPSSCIIPYRANLASKSKDVKTLLSAAV